MNEQELISKLQSLKQIKPNQEWVLLTKNNILRESSVSQTLVKANFASTTGGVFNMIFGRRFAYVVVAFLFIVTAGVFGVTMLPHSTNNNQASLVAIKGNVEEFKAKSKVLSEIAKSMSHNVPVAVKEVEDVAKEIANAIQKEPSLAKEVALEINNNKTFLNVEGEAKLQVSMDDLYKTTAENLLESYKHASLSEDGQKALHRITEAEEAGKYEGKYSNLLEDTLLFSIAVDQK